MMSRPSIQAIRAHNKIERFASDAKPSRHLKELGLKNIWHSKLFTATIFRGNNSELCSILRRHM